VRREGQPLIGVIPDPAYGRMLGRRASMAKIDATAQLTPGMTDDQRAERIRLARSAHFAELGRASGRARAARRSAQLDLESVTQDPENVAEVPKVPAVVPGDAAAAGGGDRDRTAG
jgi:hypothetical protein